MNERVRIPVTIDLEYYRQPAAEAQVPAMWLVDPDFTDELAITVYADDEESYGIPAALLELGRLQVELKGSTRALESFGKYLVALARLETEDADPHDHFEDIGYGGGGTVHFIVRRRIP